MATITKRKNADGTLSYRAQVRVKRDGKIVFSQAKTFSREKLASDWAKRLELALEQDGEIERRNRVAVSLTELIKKYENEVGAIKSFGRTKSAALIRLRDDSLGKLEVAELSAQHIIDFCKRRKLEGAGPATIAGDLSFLRSVLGVARPMFGVDVDIRPIAEAMPTLAKLGLVGKSKERDRRLEPGELERILAFYRQRDASPWSKLPMADIIEFAVFSAMRQSEICGLRWEDVDEATKTVIVRERKDPKNKADNDQVVPLLGPAWEVLQRQPFTCDYVFPFDSRSVSAAFTRGMQELGITDLCFHDLRHEGASRLFELGFAIQEVAMVTGHKNWNTLRRYTQLRPGDLHAKYPASPTK